MASTDCFANDVMSRAHTFFMLLQATTHWRALDPEARDAFRERVLMQVFQGFPGLRLRQFETCSTRWDTQCAEVAVWETDDVEEYHAAVQALHECEYFGTPYFEVISVIPTYGEAWRENDFALSQPCAA